MSFSSFLYVSSVSICLAQQYPPYPCPGESYLDPTLYGPDGLPAFRPLIIGHRGACGMYPEHTGLSYREAARQGADLIECDLALTKDHALICSHAPYLSQSTDISTKPEFAARLAMYNMDDDDPMVDWNDKGNITDWFSFDFSLEELRSLRVKQADEKRDPGFDWLEGLVTLEEMVTITREEGAIQGRTIGIYPEIKSAAATNRILAERGEALRLEDHVLEELIRLGMADASSPVLLQNFEISSLEYVASKSSLRQVFINKNNLTDLDWLRLDSLPLTGMGIGKDYLVTPGHPDRLGRGRNRWGPATEFLQKVHEHGLVAHVWTFKNEWDNLYWENGQDPYSEMEEFLQLGVDGFFSDFPLTARRFLHYKGILCSPDDGSQCPAKMV